MSGNELERVQNTKYLGVTINEHLSWEPHISATAAKAHRQLAFLDRNLRSCPQTLRETAYKTIVRPAIEYASPIWDPSSNREIRRLDTVQRHAARLVTGNPRKWHRPSPTTRLRLRQRDPADWGPGMAQSCGQASGRKVHPHVQNLEPPCGSPWGPCSHPNPDQDTLWGQEQSPPHQIEDRTP